jgi:hypothetical protein
MFSYKFVVIFTLTTISRTAVVPAQPPMQCIEEGLSPGVKASHVKLTTDLDPHYRTVGQIKQKLAKINIFQPRPDA